MAWNYRPYAWYWYVDRRNRKEYKQKQEVLTVTIDNVFTIHCAKQSHVLRHSSYCFFSKVHWQWGALCESSIVEGQLSGQLLLCCSDLSYLPEGSCMYVFGDWHHMGKTWTTRLFTSCRYHITVHMHGHIIVLFCPHFGQFVYSTLHWQAYCVSLTPFPWVLNKDHNSCTRELQVKENLHMISIHKMGCNVPSVMTS